MRLPFALVAVALALGIALTTPASPSITLDQPHETSQGVLAPDDPATKAVLIVEPRIPFSERESATLFEFLSQGGRVLLADDQGSGRSLLAEMDVGIEIPEGRLYSTSYQGDPSRTVAESTGLISALDDTVILSDPVPVLGDTGRAFLVSHELSWLDRNADGEPDLDEPRQAFPLAVLVTVGVGELMVIGDADALDDTALRDILLAHVTQDGRRSLIIDVGHQAGADPFGAAPLLAGQATTGAALLVAAAIAATGLAAFQIRLRRRTAPRRPTYGFVRPEDRLVLRELEPRRR